MNNKNLILITRPTEDAHDFAQEIEMRGFGVLSEPMLKITPVDFTPPDTERYQALIFTSANALRIFSARTGKLRSLQVYTVGRNTAAEAQKQGFSNIFSANGTSDELAQMIKDKASSRDGPILHIRGLHAAKPPHKILAKFGYTIEILVVYEAVIAKNLSTNCIIAIKNNNIGTVTFFSKRTAQNFMRLARDSGLLEHLKHIKALSISKSVLECVQPYDWEDTYVAETPDKAGMLKLLDNV